MKKIASIFLAAFTCLTIGAFAACDETPPPGPGGSTYTVTEAEWKMNFNLTKSQPSAQTTACSASWQEGAPFIAETASQSGITSYTLYAEGSNEGTSGTSLLKMTPEAMSIEFYVGGVLKESESGVFESSSALYQGLTTNILNYFPFADYYDDFTYDETKKAYLCEDLVSIVVDEYDPTDVEEMYTKSAEVTFVNGYLNTVEVELCDSTFTDVFASFLFTFSNINSTVL